MLKDVVNVIVKNYLECYMIVLLIDECLEEVIDMKCSVNVEVVFFIFDEFVDNYVCVVNIVLEKVKCFVESGYDVVILLDFIICFVWVYNIVVFVSGKVFFGGVEVNVLYKFKKFFGVVCNIEDGGFLIILVIVLIDIGFKMDGVIFEEFKGIGNMEL